MARLARGTVAVDAKIGALSPIGQDCISAHEANQVLGEVRKYLPDATLEDAAEALVQTRKAGSMCEVPTKEILAAAVDTLRRKRAYATQGTPEELAGGPPEILDRALKGDDRRMAAPMLVISRDKVAALLSKYPKAATNPDGLRSSYETGVLLKRCWLAALNVAEQAGWDGYGQKTQACAETFERLVKEDHERAIRRNKELASAEFDRIHAAVEGANPYSFADAAHHNIASTG